MVVCDVSGRDLVNPYVEVCSYGLPNEREAWTLNASVMEELSGSLIGGQDYDGILRAGREGERVYGVWAVVKKAPEGSRTFLGFLEQDVLKTKFPKLFSRDDSIPF